MFDPPQTRSEAPRLYESQAMTPTDPIQPVEYEYQFHVWPRSDQGFHPAMFALCERINTSRLCDLFTEEAFTRFRDELENDGITLREISRRPEASQEMVL